MRRECAVPGCPARAHARGLCSSHHHRLVRYGDPLVSRYSPGQPCAVSGCERLKVARELCRLHYDRDRAGAPMQAPLDHARQQPRSEHEALADLTGQLVRLGLYASREDAARFVVTLAVHWPTRADDARF